MKRMLLLLALLVVLSGCAKPAWEQINDSQPNTYASASVNREHRISFELPEEMKLMESEEGWSIYTTDNGEFEVETRRFYSSSLSSAVETLSGFKAEDISILELCDDEISEYRFAWITNSERGTRICNADLMMRGVECYAVVCSTDEASGARYMDEARQIFASYELLSDELV